MPIQATKLLRHAVTGSFVFDHKLVDAPFAGACSHLLDEVVKLQPLLPCMDQHDLGMLFGVGSPHHADEITAFGDLPRCLRYLLAARVNAPDRQGREIVFALGRISRVQRSHQVIKRRV